MTSRATSQRLAVRLTVKEAAEVLGTSVDAVRMLRVLQEQLEAERDANRENRRIIAALTSRIPAIEGPEDAPQSVDPRPDRPGPSEATAEAQEGAERPEGPEGRSWWRRVFG
jgi:hypothetical protein